MPTTIRILVAGGSFGGKSFLNSFVSKLDSYRGESTDVKFELTLVDPRAGFVNILAIPRAVVDPIFALSTYATELELPFDNTTTELYSLRFIHGRVTDLNPHSAHVEMVLDSTQHMTIEFDHCVFATGRSRPWPFDPKGYTKESYILEMQQSHDRIEQAARISIVGGGAVGIETAAELKHYFPQKQIILIHPYDNLPPELLDDDFKIKVVKRLRDIGVDLRLQTRLLQQQDNGFITTSGEFIESDLILWCGSKNNNLSPLLNEHFNSCIDHATDEVCVNDKLQIVENYADGESPFDGTFEPQVKFPNIYAVGDVTKFPVIKLAGGAWRQLQVVSTNLYNKYLGDNTVDVIRPWSNGMLMAVGSDYVISNRDGITEVNTEMGLNCYLDYCNGFVSKNYNVIFDGVDKWQ